MWTAFIIAFVVTAAYADMRWRRIPNWLTVSGVVAGLFYHGVFGGLGYAFVGMLLGFTIGLTFFRLGAIGGGDVKLITALGALLGLSRWLTAMEIAVFTAAAIALVQAIRRKALGQTGRNMLAILQSLRVNGVTAHPEINIYSPSAICAPFGLAAALGTLLAVTLR